MTYANELELTKLENYPVYTLNYFHKLEKIGENWQTKLFKNQSLKSLVPNVFFRFRLLIV